MYRIVFNGGSNGAIFRYPLLIDFSSFGSKRDSGPHWWAAEERYVTDAANYRPPEGIDPNCSRHVKHMYMVSRCIRTIWAAGIEILPQGLEL